jgi:hypothetical protein
MAWRPAVWSKGIIYLISDPQIGICRWRSIPLMCSMGSARRAGGAQPLTPVNADTHIDRWSIESSSQCVRQARWCPARPGLAVQVFNSGPANPKLRAARARRPGIAMPTEPVNRARGRVRVETVTTTPERIKLKFNGPPDSPGIPIPGHH